MSDLPNGHYELQFCKEQARLEIETEKARIMAQFKQIERDDIIKSLNEENKALRKFMQDNDPDLWNLYLLTVEK